MRRRSMKLMSCDSMHTHGITYTKWSSFSSITQNLLMAHLASYNSYCTLWDDPHPVLQTDLIRKDARHPVFRLKPIGNLTPIPPAEHSNSLIAFPHLSYQLGG